MLNRLPRLPRFLVPGAIIWLTLMGVGFVLASGGVASALGSVRSVIGMPTAVHDQVTIPVGVSQFTFDPVANDKDPDGDVLTLVSVGDPAIGVALIRDGKVVYIPMPGYVGTDRLSYEISDPGGGSVSGNVAIDVVADVAPLAADDVYGGAAPGLPLRLEVLANDRDVDGDAIRIVSLQQPSHGRATKEGDAIVYTADTGWQGVDALTYAIRDPLGLTTSARVTVATPVAACSGADDAGLDEDADRYDNADERVAGSDPCDAASAPPDADDDGTSDFRDAFALDPSNGMATPTRVQLALDPGSMSGTLLDIGFTGLMTNGTQSYASLFDPAGLELVNGHLRIPSVPAGDAIGTLDNQQYAFQVGVRPIGEEFTVHARLLAPFPFSGYESAGVFIGTGDQDNYLKLTASGAQGSGGVKMTIETVHSHRGLSLIRDARMIDGAESLDLWMEVDSADGSVRASFAIDGEEPRGMGENGNVTVPMSWLDGSRGLAVGIIATSQHAGPVFTATWDLLEVYPDTHTAP